MQYKRSTRDVLRSKPNKPLYSWSNFAVTSNCFCTTTVIIPIVNFIIVAKQICCSLIFNGSHGIVVRLHHCITSQVLHYLQLSLKHNK